MLLWCTFLKVDEEAPYNGFFVTEGVSWDLHETTYDFSTAATAAYFPTGQHDITTITRNPFCNKFHFGRVKSQHPSLRQGIDYAQMPFAVTRIAQEAPAHKRLQ